MASNVLLEAFHKVRAEETKVERFGNDQFIVIQLDDKNSLQVGLALFTAELLGSDSENIREFGLKVSVFQKSNRYCFSYRQRKNGNERMEPTEGVEKTENSLSA